MEITAKMSIADCHLGEKVARSYELEVHGIIAVEREPARLKVNVNGSSFEMTASVASDLIRMMRIVLDGVAGDPRARYSPTIGP
jgi:hypothetical protein